MILKCVSVQEGVPYFDHPISELVDKCVPGAAIQLLTPDKYISLQQIRYWKGVLLPALAKESGESIAWWENQLKFSVFPDKFKPEIITNGDKEYLLVPSITILSVYGMNQLIEGSVAYCHSIGKMWVKLPDSELR